MPVTFTRGGDVFDVYQGNGTFRVNHKGVDILDFKVDATTPTPTPDPTPDPTPTPDPVPTPTPTPTADVTNRAELLAAMASGQSMISLAPGDYGALPGIPDGTTLVSADMGNKAQFVSKSSMTGATGVTLDGLHFKLPADPTTQDQTVILYLENLQDVTITNCVVEGTRNGNGSCVGRGVRMWGNNDNVTVSNCEFHTLWKGIGLNGTSLVFRGNDIHTYRSDGLNTGTVTNCVIELNYVHDADTVEFSGDHRDSMQFMGVADGLYINDNLLDMNQGLYSQSLWSDSKNAMTNVEVKDNVIIASHTNGIAMHNISGMEVSGNVMVWQPRNDAASIGIQTPKINISAGNLTVVNNTVPAIIKPTGVDALNTIQDGDPVATRASARVDNRWSQFFT
jgi:hypothetical protein